VLTGAAGAGKTGAMILLLLAALEHRRTAAPDEREQVPVPVWLTLGGWNPEQQSLSEWVAASIYRDHAYLQAPEFGRGAAVGLLRSGRVALFLDGLDEMAPGMRVRALQEVEEASTGLRIVITSRFDEYRRAASNARWTNVADVELCPVNPATAAAYLLADQRGGQRQRWEQVGDFLEAHPDGIAARVLNTPLNLSLAREAYQAADPRELTAKFSDEQALRVHLIDRLLTNAYPDARDLSNLTYWLGWIAHHMGRHRRDLAWWQIPTWMKLWIRRLSVGLVLGTIGFVGAGQVFGAKFEPMNGTLLALAMGVTIGVLYAASVEDEYSPVGVSLRRRDRRELTATVQARASNGLVVAGVAGLVIWLGLLLAGDVVESPFVMVVGGVAFALTLGMVFGLASALIAMVLPVASKHGDPRLRVAIRAAGRGGFAGGVLVGLAAGIYLWLSGYVELKQGLSGGLLLGLVVGLIIELMGVVDAHATAPQSHVAATPDSAFSADRRAAIILGLASGLVSGILSGVALRSLAVGLTIGLLMALAETFRRPSVLIVIAQIILSADRKRGHIRFMPLLRCANRSQLLRQVGTLYQFRHAAVQDHLATLYLRVTSNQQL